MGGNWTNPRRVPGLVSVIIPSYNKAPYIEATLDSIAAQTYRDIEIVVIDDASSDESVELVRAWAASHTTTVKVSVHRENQGVCRTLNDGLALAQGEYIACIAADDRYLPHKIERHVQILKANPRASFAYGDARIEDPDGGVIHESFAAAIQQERFLSGDVFVDLLRGNFIAAPTATIRGSALDLAGPYDESLPYEDYDMWIRLARIGELACSGTVDCIYLDTPGSMSKSLGGQIELGQLMVLAKYRHDPASRSVDIDAMAITKARRAAQLGTEKGQYGKRMVELGRAAASYGDWPFATYAIAVELRRTTRTIPGRLREAMSRLPSWPNKARRPR